MTGDASLCTVRVGVKKLDCVNCTRERYSVLGVVLEVPLPVGVVAAVFRLLPGVEGEDADLELSILYYII